jgi:hypothetical protein
MEISWEDFETQAKALSTANEVINDRCFCMRWNETSPEAVRIFNFFLEWNFQL